STHKMSEIDTKLMETPVVVPVTDTPMATTTTTSTTTKANNDNNNNTTNYQTKSEIPPHKNRTEESVGIQCFLGTSRPWTGILKQRYDDFIVNEIDLSGRVITLNSLSAPAVEEQTSTTPKADLTPEQSLLALVGEEQCKAFTEFLEVTAKANPKSTFLFKEDQDKEHRTAVHKVIKEQFKLVSETEKSCVKVLARSGTKIFSMAGTKDKRGITTQSVTVFKQTAERIAGLNNRLYGVKCGGDFKYVDQQLQLGDLTGNRFTVVIRDISADDELVADSVAQFKKTGFINYYGLQRFGTGSISTNEVGKAIIRGEWQQVVNLILCPREGERPDLQQARQAYKDTGDIAPLIRALPRFMMAEHAVLKGLQKDKKGYQNAFNNLPRTLRMLYPHSYQSLIWNRMASERIKMFGFDKPVVGDLVSVGELKKPVNQDESEETNNDIPDDSTAEGDEVGDEKAEFLIQHVTEDDVANNKYSIDQVVLPMPGNEVQYPKHKIGERYKEAIAEDGITESMFTSKTRVYNLKGSYRKLISFATDIEYKVFRYNDFTAPLARKDLDKFEGKPEPKDIPNGQFRALRISFNLPSSSYATMAYRELLKQSSALQPQVAMGENSKQAFHQQQKQKQLQQEQEQQISVVDNTNTGDPSTSQPIIGVKRKLEELD
ncbi:hypothetical protein SAMD00019534_038680, partial [Acytostelium subglobosum LB1]|uniref:hypothetical protein n=1 Tax=Acytostelium subglobosum LB1 TaxID=1410327 RepID=UPI0006449C31